jgi:hypothetical protein
LKAGLKKWKVEDWLTAAIAILMLVVLPFSPHYSTIGAFFGFLTKTLTSKDSA